MNAVTIPERKPAPPMEPGQVLVEIRKYQTAHHRWPTAAEMAAELDRNVTTIREYAYRLVRNGLIERASGPLVPTNLQASPESPVKTAQWTPEQIEEHLRSLGVAPKSPPAKRAQDESEEVSAMKDAAARLPSAEVLLAEAEELRRRGEHFTKALAAKYGIDPKDVTNALYRARTGHPHGGRRGRPSGPAQPETSTSTMTSEAAETVQEAPDAPAQGAGPTERESEQAQEPEIIEGVATEGEGQGEGAEEQERRHGVLLNIKVDDEDRELETSEAKATEERKEAERVEAAQQFGWRPSDLEKSALDIASELIRRRNQRLIPALIDEIHDHETLGRVLHRLRREGVA